MKKMFFLIITIAFVSSVCFSGGASILAGVEEGDSTGQILTLIGKIDGVAQSGGIKPQITVRQDNGQQEVFGVAKDAVIIDRNGDKTSLSWINGKKVSIKYETIYAGGFYAGKMVKSIKVLPD